MKHKFATLILVLLVLLNSTFGGLGDVVLSAAGLENEASEITEPPIIEAGPTAPTNSDIQSKDINAPLLLATRSGKVGTVNVPFEDSWNVADPAGVDIKVLEESTIAEYGLSSEIISSTDMVTIPITGGESEDFPANQTIVVKGTPTKGGVAKLVITASDGYGNADTYTLNITISLPEKMDVTATKIWVGGEYQRSAEASTGAVMGPEVYFQLQRKLAGQSDNSYINLEGQKKQIPLNINGIASARDEIKVVFPSQATADTNGIACVYRVIEVNASGDVVVDNDTRLSVEDGRLGHYLSNRDNDLQITNAYVPQYGTIRVRKEWVAPVGTSTPDLYLTLYQRLNSAPHEEASYTMTPDTTYLVPSVTTEDISTVTGVKTVGFDIDMPFYALSGEELKFFAVESDESGVPLSGLFEAVSGYNRHVSGYPADEYYAFRALNIMQFKNQSTHTWVDENGLEIPAAVTVPNAELTMTSTFSVDKIQSADAANKTLNWGPYNYSNADGSLVYTHTLTHSKLPAGYELQAATRDDGTYGNMQEGYAFVYKYNGKDADGKLKTIQIIKEWLDHTGEALSTGLPETLTVTLKGSDGSSQDVVLTQADGWTKSVSDLFAIGKDGKEITYTVEENNVPTCFTLSGIEENQAGVFLITNTAEVVLIPIEQDPPVQKMVEGDAAPSDAKFTFEMRAVTPDAPMPEGSLEGVKTKTITGAQSFEFGIMTFTEEETYVYQLRELATEHQGFTDDQTQYTMTVTITRDGNRLVKAVTYDNGNTKVDRIVFTNVFKKVTKPTETTVPTKPTETTVPTKPTETTVPTKPTETTVPTKPMETTNPTVTADPSTSPTSTSATTNVKKSTEKTTAKTTSMPRTGEMAQGSHVFFAVLLLAIGSALLILKRRRQS